MKRTLPPLAATFVALSLLASTAVAGPPPAKEKPAKEEPVYLSFSERLLAKKPVTPLKYRVRRTPHDDVRAGSNKFLPEDPAIISVTRKESDGRKVVVLPVTPLLSEDIIADAFRKKLVASGFTVHQVRRIPKDARKWLRISNVEFDVEEHVGIMRDNGSSTLTAELQVGGATAPETRTCSVTVTDSAWIDRSSFASRLARKSVDALLLDAAPAIVEQLKK